MARAFRRYEILLPLRFNDDSSVPDELIAETLAELHDRFGAESRETQTIEGRWSSQGELYRDDMVRVFVDVPDLPENRDYFLDLKERLKLKFGQLEIWMTTFPLDVL